MFALTLIVPPTAALTFPAKAAAPPTVRASPPMPVSKLKSVMACAPLAPLSVTVSAPSVVVESTVSVLVLQTAAVVTVLPAVVPETSTAALAMTKPVPSAMVKASEAPPYFSVTELNFVKSAPSTATSDTVGSASMASVADWGVVPLAVKIAFWAVVPTVAMASVPVPPSKLMPVAGIGVPAA
jgi:hypothetical protein